MAGNNDEKVLLLQKKIEEKRAALKKSERFSPVTNCSLDVSFGRYNLNVITYEQCVYVVCFLKALQIGADAVREDGIECDEPTVSGYLVSHWLQDIYARMAILQRSAELKKLAAMEAALASMLSDDYKVSKELERIMRELGE